MVERKNLELSVRDFGPIARAEIDLRPLTVFVGPSNTGKSYLAILIYALHRFFNSNSAYPSSTYPRGFLTMDGGVVDFSSIPNISEENDADLNVSDLLEWLGSLYRQVGYGDGPTEKFSVPVPSFISQTMAPLLRNVGTLVQELDLEVARCLGIMDTSRIIRYEGRNNSARVSIKRQIPSTHGSSEPFEYEFTARRNGAEFAAYILDDAPMFLDRIDDDDVGDLIEWALYIRYLLDQSEPDVENWRRQSFFLMNHLAWLVECYIRNPLNRRACYLPADRAGVMHTHRMAVGSLIERAAYPEVSNVPVIPGVIADFLAQLVRLDPRENRWEKESEHVELFERVERNMLKGSVRFENSATGHPIFFYRPDGWKEDIPLMNTSSSVSELAPVVLYLRHVVQPGETLIIEEPESHLHPAMQVEFTRQLAAVVRAGVRVIITTHSEWVLDELANLVRVSGLPKSRREGIRGADYALRPEQLGVWLFEPKRRPRGSVVKEIPFDEDFGGFRSGFDEVSMGTYNDYAAISNRLERSGS